ncbi:MAG TPA: amidohydrolase [Bacteroidota bacterium]
MKVLIVVHLICFLVFPLHAQEADLAIINAKVWTADEANQRAEAFAVRAGKFVFVGTTEEVMQWVGKETKVIDAEGKLVLPGLIDNHTHFLSGGFQLQSVDLRDAKNETEFAERIKTRADKYPNRWISGGDWDHDNWPGGNLPTKELIDKQTPNTPVFVSRYDGHMALANSVVLKIAGITEDTPDPPGGTIVKDPVTGEPTGILKDEAMSFVYRHMPEASEDELMEAARLALAEARKFGLTSIQDMAFSSHVKIYKRLKEEGELTARMYCRLPIGMTDELIKAGMKAGDGDEWIRTGSLKAFADGSLGSSTALFFEPYDSDPTTRGLPSDLVLDGRLEKWAMAGDRAGMQLSIHAIGDSANGLMLDLFEKIIHENPRWDRRFRIEHAQHIRPPDFKRFARLHVIASVQPYHAIDDGRWAESRIGHERCKTTYAFKSFLDAGVRLSFGSDWTVAPLNPFLGIYAAVTRRTTDGNNPEGWFPEQKISVEEALKAYTMNNAYASFEENVKGSIRSGKLADFIMVDRDILTIDPVQIEDTTVLATFVGGKEVFGSVTN